MNIKKIIAYYLAAVFFFTVMVFANTASASTTYETAAPILQSSLTQTGACCSGADNYSQNVDVLPLPNGITFNNVFLAGTATGTPNFTIFLMRDDGIPLSSYVGNGSTWPLNDDTTLATLYSSEWVNVSGGLQSGTFATTTITGSNYYLQFHLTSAGSFQMTRNIQTEEGYRLKANSSAPYYTTTVGGTAMKLCNGLCDNYTFSAIPNLTVTPWVRMTSPLTGSTIQSGTTIPLNFQANTGTTSADNVIVRFSSSFQTFIPYEVNLTQTGINLFSYDLNLPSFDDTIQIEAQMYSGTTSIVVSPTYSINVSSNPLDSVDNGFSCDVSIWEPSSFFTCAASFVGYLFIPPSDTPALVWYSMGTEAVDTESIFTEAYNQALTALGTTPTSSVTALDMSIDITTPASTTINLPIISMGAFNDKAPQAVDFFRTLALGALVLFALQNYLKQVNEALVIITYKGLS